MQREYCQPRESTEVGAVPSVCWILVGYQAKGAGQRTVTCTQHIQGSDTKPQVESTLLTCDLVDRRPLGRKGGSEEFV